MLAEASARSELDVAGALDDLVRRQLLVPESSRLRFQHDLTREAIYQEISDWRIRLLHRRAAQMLEQQPQRQSEYTAVNFHRDAGKDFGNRSWRVRDSIVTIDPSFSTTSDEGEINGPQSCSFLYDAGDRLELRIFVDRCIVEVFVNGQSACLTRVYPEKPDSLGFSIQSRGRPAVCQTLRAWTMERVFL